MKTEELINLDSTELFKQLDLLKSKAIELGATWAELNQTYRDLEKLMPSTLAVIQTVFSKSGGKTTESRVQALASEDYQNKLLAMNKAEYEAEVVRAEYRVYIEAMKAIQAIAYVRNNELRLAR